MMSKSLTRVCDALNAAAQKVDLREMTSETRTAQQAADAVGCALDQIVKSILFQGQDSGALYLFLTAGGRQVDPDKAAALTHEPLQRADANEVRRVTGFAIGGVSPVGHLTALSVFCDPRLMEFGQVWAAAGTPRHVFGIDPTQLLKVSRAVPAEFCHGI